MTTILTNVKEILAYGANHSGGVAGSRRHARSAIAACKVGQLFLDASAQEIADAEEYLRICINRGVTAL